MFKGLEKQTVRELYVRNFNSLCDRAYLINDSFAQCVLFAIPQGKYYENFENNEESNYIVNNNILSTTKEYVIFKLPGNTPFTVRSIVDELTSIGCTLFTSEFLSRQVSEASSTSVLCEPLEHYSNPEKIVSNKQESKIDQNQLTFRFLFPEDWEVYLKIIEVKHNAYSNILQERLREEIVELIEIYTVRYREMQFSLYQRIYHLNMFITSFEDFMPCFPFIAGLERCLRSQLKGKVQVKWTLPDIELTQCGHNFLESCIKLLFLLDFSPTSKDEATPDHHRVWHSRGVLTSTEVSSLLSLFPKNLAFCKEPCGTLSFDDLSKTHSPRWFPTARVPVSASQPEVPVTKTSTGFFQLVKEYFANTCWALKR
ncbi:uncharacterized protein LOC135120430 isoform X2 [Zophobas morio]|uniref:uncharacterized protein LOC135120430 isoform X2 n=1 Tax=Zophobas morio TaxID=2755281 RepID=UPI0030834775